jgi:hypothetical protein
MTQSSCHPRLMSEPKVSPAKRFTSVSSHDHRQLVGGVSLRGSLANGLTEMITRSVTFKSALIGAHWRPETVVMCARSVSGSCVSTLDRAAVWV